MREERPSMVGLDIVLDTELERELGEALGADLAEVTEAVVIGPVPTAAVMARGRRRKVRRRSAVAALVAAVLLPAGGLTMAAATGGEKTRGSDGVATQPAGPGLLTPITATLGTLKFPDGAVRKVEITVYLVPRTVAEAREQIKIFEKNRRPPWGYLERPGLAKELKDGSFGHMWYVASYVEGNERHTFGASGIYKGGGSGGLGAGSSKGKHIGVWVGKLGSAYGAVEIGWGKHPKVRPELVSVPGVPAVKFYVAAMPEKYGPLHTTIYDKEGKVVSRH